jgi:bis(5'-nucleosyl)-tetraphosphatase (symmetrical)
MATYAIGDIQGCYATLRALLRECGFDAARDRLLLVGDLVNRGPASADVLRFAMGLGDRVVAVLGNHELHLLGRALGVAAPKRRDTLDDVLDAPERDEMLRWVRSLPLAHREGDLLLVHAGLLPPWSAEQAITLAAQAARVLADEDGAELLRTMSAGAPRCFDDGLAGLERHRVVVQGLTRVRTCLLDGTPDFDFNQAPAEAPPGRIPWFDHPTRVERDATVVFGHWASLGLHLAPHALGLDTGAVWGHALTALRLEDRALFQQPTIDPLPSGPAATKKAPRKEPRQARTT